MTKQPSKKHEDHIKTINKRKYKPSTCQYLISLESIALYAGLLLASVEGFGLGFFCPSGKQNGFLYSFCLFLGIFGLSRKLSKFEKIQTKNHMFVKSESRNKNIYIIKS